MDDAAVVRGFQNFGDLAADSQRFRDFQRTVLEALRQRLARRQLQNQIVHAGGFFDPVDPRDVRVIQGGQHLRFALESRQPLGIFRKSFRQDLDGNLAAKLTVSGAIHHAHSAGA